ncbi:MAG TPA: hypothetical protein VHW73_00580 [Rudaea sp.]|jgi:hypothetical protein|nr:hypothetical protein [Rudaea sp.]
MARHVALWLIGAGSFAQCDARVLANCMGLARRNAEGQALARSAQVLLPSHHLICILRIGHNITEDHMGKYFLAWLLGVPAGLLVLIYVFTHVF